MKLSFQVLLLIFAGLLLVVCVSCKDSTDDDSSDVIETARGKFRLPKLFNFTRFKEIFNKSYASVLDELVRKKLFLARTFKAFISVVGYKHQKVSSYSSVNQMSDWTNAEWRATLIKPEIYYENIEDLPVTEEMAQFLAEQKSNSKANQATSDDKTQLVDTQQIKRKFAEIVENPDSKLGYHEIADEIIKQQGEDWATLDDSEPVESDRAEPDQQQATNFVASNLAKLNYKSLMSFVSDTVSKMLDYLDLTIQSAFIWATTKRPGRSELPDEIFHDHRQCLNAVRDQGDCGSCFIFSTIAMYEWAYCRAHGTKIKFSEQYVLDCGGQMMGVNGCNGGIERAVGRFVQKYGFELLDRYRYRAREQECPYDLNEIKSNEMGLVRLDRPRMRFVPYNRYEEQLKSSPFMIVIRTGMDFFDYGGGVHLNNNCKQGDELHSVLLVGSGREDGHEYWLIRNSHGSYWGEKGYYKMRKGSSCLGSLGYGFIMEAFRPDILPDSVAEMLPPVVSLFEPTWRNKEYNFTENPRYDWKILAKRFFHRSAPKFPGEKKNEKDIPL